MVKSEKHLKTQHKGKARYKCDYCENSFASKTSLNYHMEKHPDNMCPRCFKMFHNKYNMRLHFKTQHKGKAMYKCDHCEQSFASKTSLNYHVKKHHSDSTGILCENCDEICPDFKSYIEHIDLHSRLFYDNVGHNCTECELIIHGKRNLRRHMSEVHNQEQKLNSVKTSIPSFSHVCDECNFRTKRKYDLKEHKKHQHSPGIEIVFPCDKCDKTFKYSRGRRRHDKITHGHISPQPKSTSSQNSTSEEAMVGDATLKQTKAYKVVKPRKAWFSGPKNTSTETPAPRKPDAVPKQKPDVIVPKELSDKMMYAFRSPTTATQHHTTITPTITTSTTTTSTTTKPQYTTTTHYYTSITTTTTTDQNTEPGEHPSGLGQMMNPGNSCFGASVILCLTEVEVDLNLDPTVRRNRDEDNLDGQLRTVCGARRDPARCPQNPVPLILALNFCLCGHQQGTGCHCTQFNFRGVECAMEFLQQVFSHLAILPNYLVAHQEVVTCAFCQLQSQQVFIVLYFTQFVLLFNYIIFLVESLEPVLARAQCDQQSARSSVHLSTADQDTSNACPRPCQYHLSLPCSPVM